ncbi:hypothetical protein J6590_030229 [Homalodisca vitripennis]|nr:hypothetical protein J6590_030229 [Homalodisca vitripennis]
MLAAVCQISKYASQGLETWQHRTPASVLASPQTLHCSVTSPLLRVELSRTRHVGSARASGRSSAVLESPPNRDVARHTMPLGQFIGQRRLLLSAPELPGCLYDLYLHATSYRFGAIIVSYPSTPAEAKSILAGIAHRYEV